MSKKEIQNNSFLALTSGQAYGMLSMWSSATLRVHTRTVQAMLACMTVRRVAEPGGFLFARAVCTRASTGTGRVGSDAKKAPGTYGLWVFVKRFAVSAL